MKKKILVFIRWYLPGFRSGGPVRSISNLVSAFGDEFDFYIVSRNRDFGMTQAYECCAGNEKQWQEHGQSHILYLAPNEENFLRCKELIQSEDWDLLYLQSFFDLKFSVLPLLAWRCFRRQKPILIAPRGEFGQGALNIRKYRKRIFIALYYLLIRSKKLFFHVSSTDERNDAVRVLGRGAKCIQAMNLPASTPDLESVAPQSGSVLRMCFLSRLSPKKNLLFALDVLKDIKSPVEFDIYGIWEDESYHKQCCDWMKQLPGNVCVRYGGAVEHDRVMAVFSQYDLFFFPTTNENYGHVIHESLCAGTPVLCSDQTPWHELGKRNAGWEVVLDRKDKFVEIIEQYAAMDQSNRQKMRIAARKYGFDMSNANWIYTENERMFREILS